MRLRIIILLYPFLTCFSVASSQSPYADSLQKIIDLGKHDETERIAYSRLAVYYFKSDPVRSKKLMLLVLKLADEADDHMRLSSAYGLLLQIYKDEGNIDSANYIVNKFRKLADSVPDSVKVQGNFNQAVGLYYKKNGDFKTALPYSLAAIKFAEKGSADDKAYIGGQWVNAGNIYMELGEYKNAMDCNLKALRLFEASGSKRGEGFCYTNMALIYINLKQYGNALKSAQKSLDIKTQLKDTRGVCTALEAIGQAHMNMNHLTEAFSNYEKALKIAVEEKMPASEMTCYFNMAKIFAAEDNDSLAIDYFKKSKVLALQLEDKQTTASLDMELAALYRNANNQKHTEEALYTTLETFRETGSLVNESDNYRRLAEFYASTKQYDKALEFSNKYHNIKDSITGINIQVQLKKLEEQYNSEKKEKEIALLKTDKDLQKQRLLRQRILFGAAAALLVLSILGIILLINRNRLRQRMKELELRNQIAADLHDEVGSSLSSIQLLSQMATTQGNGSSDQRKILEKMNINARETMDKMSDIVWMIKPGETEAGSLKQKMEGFANEICSSKSIQLSMDLSAVENVKLSMAQRKNIYLIFKEAVNNAVKYSGTEQLEVKTTVQNRLFELSVKDFGKGFEQAAKGRGNGLDNMRNRAKESGGILAINSTQGTAITLAVKL